MVEVILGFVNLGDDMGDVEVVRGEASPEDPMQEANQEDTTTVAAAVVHPHQDSMAEATGSTTEEDPDESMEAAAPPVTREEVLPASSEEVQPDQALHVSCRHPGLFVVSCFDWPPCTLKAQSIQALP